MRAFRKRLCAAALAAFFAASARGQTPSAPAEAPPALAKSLESVLASPYQQARLRLFESEDPPQPAPEAAPAPREPKWIWIGAFSAIAIGGSAVNAYAEDPRFPWHVTDEGWFGQDTYVGGADKASHFVSFYGVARIMNELNLGLGANRDQAMLIAAGTSFLAGLATEIGDGTNKYGFSWEDLTMDALGAATALAIVHYRLDDLVGFRFGLVPGPTSAVGGLGKDYSEEIYTADLKIEGLGRRLHFNPGPARFLLLSTTYGAKGYPYALPEDRQRQIGIELGINFGEVLKALHVPPKRWWGVILYTFFDIVRIPYTAWGYRYDLNNGKWYGPNTGNTYPP